MENKRKLKPGSVHAFILQKKDLPLDTRQNID